MITLRDYQKNAVDSVFREWETVRSTLGVAATGTGKTTIFAEVVRRMQPQRAMIVAHREELIFQARDRIENQAGIDCEVEMAEMQASTSLFHRTPVVVGTVQTMISGGERRRIQRFDPNEFGLLIIDEAHHAAAASYKFVLDHFKQNPDLKILGVTATPDRADEEALGQMFETVAFDYEILDAIKEGWLVPVQQQMVEIKGLDYSDIRTTAGELNNSDLAAVMEAEKNLHGMVGAAIDIIGDRRTIMFTTSVRQAELSCEIFNRYRSGMAGWICGKTGKDDRRETMARFASGKLQVMCNVGCLTEGVDVPAAEVCIMGRPTKSRSLYAQMAGRIMRVLPGLVDGLTSPEERRQEIEWSMKPTCLIVDFVGNSGRHKLMTSADILGGNVSDEAVELAIRKAKASGKPLLMSQCLDEAEEEIVRERERKRLEAEARRDAEAARKARLKARVSYRSTVINPFDAFELKPAKERGWDAGKHLTEKQRGVLLKQGIDPDRMPYTQARQLLNEQFRRWNGGLCTLKQATLLKRFGYETHDLTMKDASALIDILAKNKWQRPMSGIPLNI